MASTACSECSRQFSTSRDTYPYCSYACKDEATRRASRASSRPGPRRPGRVHGF